MRSSDLSAPYLPSHGELCL
ncbi:unnamed protein product, partial [Fusarium fujikuroi]